MKKISALLLAAVLILTAGCGGNIPEEPAKTETPAVTEAPGTTKAPETTETPGTTKAPETAKAPETEAQTTAEPVTTVADVFPDAVDLAPMKEYRDYEAGMYFRIQVEDESIVSPWIEDVAYSHMLFDVYDSSGAKMNPENVYAKCTGIALSPGTYYLCLNSGESWSDGTPLDTSKALYYDLEVVGAPANTSGDTACAMESDTMYPVTFTDTNGGERWFTFTLDHDSNVELFRQGEEFELCDAAGKEFTPSESSARSIYYEDLPAGDYYVKITCPLEDSLTTHAGRTGYTLG